MQFPQRDQRIDSDRCESPMTGSPPLGPGCMTGTKRQLRGRPRTHAGRSTIHENRAARSTPTQLKFTGRRGPRAALWLHGLGRDIDRSSWGRESDSPSKNGGGQHQPGPARTGPAGAAGPAPAQEGGRGKGGRSGGGRPGGARPAALETLGDGQEGIVGRGPRDRPLFPDRTITVAT
jgi:hypothetical protein